MKEHNKVCVQNWEGSSSLLRKRYAENENIRK